MEKVIVLGCGGHAKSIVDMIEQQGKYEIVGFVTNEAVDECKYRGYPILGTDASLQKLFQSGVENAVVGVGYLGNSRIRDQLYMMLKSIGFQLPVISDRSAIIANDVIIGEGTVIGKGAIINSDTIVGAMGIVNTGAIIEHDCKVEDFVHIAIRGTLGGGVRVGKHTFIGAGTTVIQGITIGENAIIGAGSTVLNSVQPNALVYGIVK